MNDLNCSNYNSVTYQITNPNCCSIEPDELDLMITNLKSEIFEKQQNGKDYCALENKFRQLQNDIQILADQKLRLEQELAESKNNGNLRISNYRAENENIMSELNEKNLLNKKTYGDNNNLYQTLEGISCENQKLHEQICDQEDILDKLNQEKCGLVKTLHSLNHLNEKQKNDIQNLKDQISLSEKQSNDLLNSLRFKNSENNQIINEFKSEKNVNDKLITELKNKEAALMQSDQELCMAQQTLCKLEDNLNSLNLNYNNNKDEMVCINNNLLKETSTRNQVENNNKKLGEMINDRDIKIQKLVSDNDILKTEVNNLNNNANLLQSQIEAYKKHILIVTEQNDKLSKELEIILSRDAQLINTLSRVNHLRSVEEENKNVINSSLESLKNHIRNHGNMGNREGINIRNSNSSVNHRTYISKYNNISNINNNDINNSKSNNINNSINNNISNNNINISKNNSINNNINNSYNNINNSKNNINNNINNSINNNSINNINNSIKKSDIYISNNNNKSIRTGMQNSNNFDDRNVNGNNSLVNSQEGLGMSGSHINNINENGNNSRIGDNQQYFGNKDQEMNQYSGGEEEQQNYSGGEEEQQYSGGEEEQQYSGGEEQQYSGGEEEMQYSGGEEEMQYSGGEEEMMYSGGEEEMHEEQQIEGNEEQIEGNEEQIEGNEEQIEGNEEQQYDGAEEGEGQSGNEENQ